MSDYQRKSISKSLRYDVLNRDCFACVYCGARPPDTKLHVDHINPVVEGGTNDIGNLVTACVDCNLGKGADRSLVSRNEHDRALRRLRSVEDALEITIEEGLVGAEYAVCCRLDDDGSRLDKTKTVVRKAYAAGISITFILWYAIGRFDTWDEWLQAMSAQIAWVQDPHRAPDPDARREALN